MNNQRQIGQGLLLYADDYDAWYPYRKEINQAQGNLNNLWGHYLSQQGKIDLRPITRKYFGDNFDLFNDPFAPKHLDWEAPNISAGTPYFVLAGYQSKNVGGTAFGGGMLRIGDELKTINNKDDEVERKPIVIDLLVRKAGGDKGKLFQSSHQPFGALKKMPVNTGANNNYYGNGLNTVPVNVAFATADFSASFEDNSATIYNRYDLYYYQKLDSGEFGGAVADHTNNAAKWQVFPIK